MISTSDYVRGMHILLCEQIISVFAQDPATVAKVWLFRAHIVHLVVQSIGDVAKIVDELFHVLSDSLESQSYERCT
jgi:hypothetical protein